MPSVFEAINSPLGSTMGQGVSWTPQQYLSYLEMLANSPQGQAAQRAQQQTAEFQINQALEQLKLQRDQLAITRGQAEANRWYQQEQLKLAQQAHQLAVQQQQWSQQYQTAGLTGELNGSPTLANLAQQANFLGTYNGQPTQQAINQQQQFGLQQGQLTGQYNGAPTLAAIGQQQNYGLNLAGVTGYAPNGDPTFQRQQWETGQTGYLNGAPTLQRQQAAAGTALQGAGLLAQLQGPENWATYLQAANALANSPASALVQSTPGGLGATNLAQTVRPQSLGNVLAQAGMTPNMQRPPTQAPQGGQGIYQGQPASFNEGGAGNDGFAAWASQFGMPMNEQAAQARMRQLRAQWQTMTPEQKAPYAPTGAGKYGAGGPSMAGLQPGEVNYAGGTPGWINPGAAGNRGEGRVGITDPGFNPNAAQQRGQLMQATGRGTDNMVSAQPYTGAGQGYDPLAALAQVAAAPRPTNAQLGLSDGEAEQLRGWFASPGQSPTGWLESKSPDQRKYLSGLASSWGFSPADVDYRYRNTRPKQLGSMTA
jgi:hypothetical protein